MARNRTLTDHAAVAAAFTLAASVATLGWAQSVVYEVTDLGAPIGGATFGSALNNVGQAAGVTCRVEKDECTRLILIPLDHGDAAVLLDGSADVGGEP